MSNLTITANTDYTLKLVYKDAAGFAVDITGASARMVLRRGMYSQIVLDKAADITGATGEIVFNLTPTDTANILNNRAEEETFIYGIELTTADTKKRDILSGKAVIKQSITRA